ncbi:hypothetical protein HDU97_001547 [Phlyctochytrium planicorne]|nr:hypothetical protein HDU97_001547 [Phlyctochytrium planicorne]
MYRRNKAAAATAPMSGVSDSAAETTETVISASLQKTRPHSSSSPKPLRKSLLSLAQSPLNSLPPPTLKGILKYCSPHLSRLTRLSKTWRHLIMEFARESSKKFKEGVEEAECWSYRAPTVDDIVGCDPLVLHRILWDVYAIRIATAAGGGPTANASQQRGLGNLGGGATNLAAVKEGLSTDTSGINSAINPSNIGGAVILGGNATQTAQPDRLRIISRAGTTNSVMGGPGSQAALSRLIAFQRQLFRAFRISLDTYAEGGWASISTIKDFIRKMRLQFVISHGIAAAPALSLLAEGGLPAAVAAAANREAALAMQARPTALAGMLEGQGGNGEAGSENAVVGTERATGDAGESGSTAAAVISNAPAPVIGNNVASSTATSSTTKAPAMPSTTLSTSTPTATLLTAQDVRPRPPKDSAWFLLNADLCRLASAYGQENLLPTLSDLDPEASAQILTLATSDATRHKRYNCLASLLDMARLLPGALWPCLERGLGSAILAEEDGCPTSSACVLLLLDAACNDAAGPRAWAEAANGGIAWGAVDARERLSSVLSTAHAAITAAVTASSTQFTPGFSLPSQASFILANPSAAPSLGTASTLAMASRIHAPSLSSLPSLTSNTAAILSSPPPGAQQQAQLAGTQTEPPSSLSTTATATASATTSAAVSLQTLLSSTSAVSTLLSTSVMATTKSTLDASDLAASILEKVDEVRKVYNINWHRFPRHAVLTGLASQSPYQVVSAPPGSIGSQAFNVSMASLPIPNFTSFGGAAGFGMDGYRVVAAGEVANGLVNGLMGRKSVVS